MVQLPPEVITHIGHLFQRQCNPWRQVSCLKHLQRLHIRAHRTIYIAPVSWWRYHGSGFGIFTNRNRQLGIRKLGKLGVYVYVYVGIMVREYERILHKNLLVYMCTPSLHYKSKVCMGYLRIMSNHYHNQMLFPCNHYYNQILFPCNRLSFHHLAFHYFVS